MFILLTLLSLVQVNISMQSKSCTYKETMCYTSKQNKNKIQEKFKSLGWKVFQICGSGNDEFYVSNSPFAGFYYQILVLYELLIQVFSCCLNL